MGTAEQGMLSSSMPLGQFQYFLVGSVGSYAALNPCQKQPPNPSPHNQMRQLKWPRVMSILSIWLHMVTGAAIAAYQRDDPTSYHRKVSSPEDPSSGGSDFS